MPNDYLCMKLKGAAIYGFCIFIYIKAKNQLYIYNIYIFIYIYIYIYIFLYIYIYIYNTFIYEMLLHKYNRGQF